MTTGTFDGVHIGHRAILNRLVEIAKSTGGESVLFTFDPHPRMVLFPEDHGLQLLNSREEKVKLLREVGIDHVIFHPFSKEFARLTALEYVRNILIDGIGVQTMVIGYDHRFGRNREGDFEKLTEFSEMFNFNIEEIPAHEVEKVNVSSTKIRKALQNGQVKTANEYLGYNYSVSGIVIEGDGIGRTIGFPTANVKVPDPLKLVPGNGVYAVKVQCDGKEYRGMMNSGVRPTITSSGDLRMEVHIIDEDLNLYGKDIVIEFVDRIREEQRFENKDALIHQLQIDQKNAIEILK